MITADDRERLEDAGVTPTNIDRFADLVEPEAITLAVTLVASGTDPKEAIRQGKKVKAAKKKAAETPKTDGAGDVSEAPPAPKAKDMTDDEWLDTYCGKLLKLLPFKGAFKRDAILYRRTQDKIVALRTGTKKHLAEAKKPAENGQFFANMFRLVRASHPMHWLVCDGCNGTGHLPDDKSKSCNRCLGGGYKLKFEET